MRNVLFIICLSLSFSAFSQSRRIVIDKPALKLYVIEKKDTIFSAPVCAGKNYGQKMRRGDMRTPEGSFTVNSIEDSRMWTHDFGDGAGQRKGAYGPWFIRLKIPQWAHIGIHGTCFPKSIGTRDSEGCVRLLNADLERLKPLVRNGMSVEIKADKVKK